MKLLNINIMLILFLLSLNFVSATGGGGDVPISTISLNEPDNNYNMTSGRLKFEFEKEWYAIQLIRVKDEYADFIVMNLDKDNLEDITAYWIIEDTFSLNPSVYLGKTGNQVCKSLGYATCVSLNDATLINGGENRAESAGPCTGDSVVINDIKVVERHQEGTYTSSVSCCRLK